MKKYTVVTIALICLLLFSYSVIAFASTPTTSESSKIVDGTFVSVDATNLKIEINTPSGVQIYPLAKSIWVYRDQKVAIVSEIKANDQVELIFNSKDQVAYIKAVSVESVNKEVIQTVSNPKNENNKNEQQNTTNTASEPKAVSSVEQTQKQQIDLKNNLPILNTNIQTITELWADIKQLKIDLQDPNTKIKIDIKPNHPKFPAKIKIYSKDSEKIQLTGADAEQFILQVLGNINTIDTATQKELIVNQLVSLFNLNQDKLKVHVIMKTVDQKENYHYNLKNNKYKDDESNDQHEMKTKEIKNEERKDEKKVEHKVKKEIKTEMKKEMKEHKKEEKHKENGKGKGKQNKKDKVEDQDND